MKSTLLTIDFLPKQLSVDHPVRVKPDVSQCSCHGVGTTSKLDGFSHKTIAGHYYEEDDHVVGHVSDLKCALIIDSIEIIDSVLSIPLAFDHFARKKAETKTFSLKFFQMHR